MKTTTSKLNFRQRFSAMFTGRVNNPVKISKKGVRAFDMAASGRLFDDWTKAIISHDSQLLGHFATIRERGRDLCKNDDYAKKFQNMCVVNVVGPNGIGLQMDIQDASGAVDQSACDIIEDAWKEFSKKENFTVTGKWSRPQAEAQLVKNECRDGEFLVRIVRGYKGNRFNYSLQPMDPDHLDHELNQVLPNGNEIRMGVQYDEWQKPVYYWIKTKADGDFFANRAQVKYEKIPASEIIHGFIADYVHQSRGVSWFQASAKRLRMLGKYEAAALIAARIGASKMGFLHPPKGEPGEDWQGDGENADGNKMMDMEPGSFEETPPGYTVSTYDPTYPHAEHGNFCKATLRGAAAGLLVPYNELAGDLEGVNFSSVRAGVLEARESWILLQNHFIDSFEAVVFRDWLEWCLDMGKIKLPREKFDKFHKPIFYGRRWQWVDPEKDLQAAKIALQLKLKTRGDIIAEMTGESFEEVCRRVDRERKIAAKYKIDLDELDRALSNIQTPAGNVAAGAELKSLSDGYGAAVRAGGVTPTKDDEVFFRALGKLPPINPAIAAAWESDGQVRRPITLKSQEGFEAEEAAAKKQAEQDAAKPPE